MAFIIIIGGISVQFIYIYITRIASNEIFSPSNKIHEEVSRAKDLSAPLMSLSLLDMKPCILADNSLLNYRYRITEDDGLYSHLHDNLKSYMMTKFLRSMIYSPCPKGPAI